MSAIKVSFQQVRKEFPVRGEGGRLAHRLTALEDITFDVRTGEFLALVGPSGCGKSTLLDLLGGLTLPTSGRILLDGRLIAGPARDRGIVFQQYALFPWRTAAENVEFGLDIAGLKPKQRCVGGGLGGGSTAGSDRSGILAAIFRCRQPRLAACAKRRAL
jgi:NitT/TauT family transport system ATP-binding protein